MWYRLAKSMPVCDLFDADMPDISSESIEGVLSDEPFDAVASKKNGIRSMERAGCVPMMSISFHGTMMDMGRLPTLAEYVDGYEKRNARFLSGLDEPTLAGITARVIRAFPSLVRDVHFVSVARELGADVCRTLRDDIRGTDATILTASGPRFIRLYYDSPRARKFRIAKAMAHDVSEEHVDFPLTRENADEVGNVFLYSRAAIEELLESMQAVRRGTRQEESTCRT
jgi:hypothetical protein